MVSSLNVRTSHHEGVGKYPTFQEKYYLRAQPARIYLRTRAESNPQAQDQYEGIIPLDYICCMFIYLRARTGAARNRAQSQKSIMRACTRAQGAHLLILARTIQR